jgi:hypothetical protein
MRWSRPRHFACGFIVAAECTQLNANANSTNRADIDMDQNDRNITRALGEPVAFALLQWPALLVVVLWDGAEGWRYALRCALLAWCLVMTIAAYTGGRGRGFGNAMLVMAVCVAGASWWHPSPWAWALVAPLPLMLLVAQRLRLRACLGVDEHDHERDHAHDPVAAAGDVA